ncbi:MAG: hypothetical protein K0R76_1533 [Alphaproteobacteria bacterium]|jgi:uncharacterized protein (DUF1778 family)|nr:hypothetical protein [Alphaproteobacteria bacterium]
MEMTTQPVSKRQKDTAITLRISKQQKFFLSQAAKVRHTTLTNFVIEEAFHAAQDTLADQVRFILDDTQWQLFCDALDRPAVPIEATRKLLREPSILDPKI